MFPSTFYIAAPVTDIPAPIYHFNPETASSRKFPFRPNLMNYIFDNAKAPVLYDLYKTCKWFYCYFPIEIIYSFVALPDITNGIQTQSIEISNLQSLNLDNKLYVTSVFRLYFPEADDLSNFMPNIYRCSAKYISIDRQYLTFNELKFLIGHGEVVELNMSVRDQNGNPFKFEEIITLIPKIRRLHICDTICSANISKFLCDFPFQNKIEKFYFANVEILPDPNAFAEFILKNASPNRCSRFSFYNGLTKLIDFLGLDNNDEFDNEEKMAFRRFESIVNDIIDGKWEGLNRPYFSI